MKKSALPLGILLVAAGVSAAAAQPAQLRNAKVTVQPVSPGTLAREVDRIASASKGPVWIGYSQPVVDGKHRMCCFDSISRRGRKGGDDFCCGGCVLESDRSFTIGNDNRNAVTLESDSGLVVLFRASGGEIQGVRALDDECGIDVGGLPFVWLDGVRPEESVAFLASLAGDLDGRHHGEDAAGSALAAIGLTGHSSADAALEALVRPGRPLQLREQAAFWLGNSRGRRGYEVLRAIAADDSPGNEELRRHVTFALSQSAQPEAIATLIGMAKKDSSAEVRGQALFWLAQEAGDRAAEAIRDAIRDDPDEEVKTKAVFALSQLKSGDGVAELIRVARTNRNPEVRKQAIFWLGQSKDPRALKFIEEILTQ